MTEKSLNYGPKKLASSYKCIIEIKPLKQDLNCPDTILPLPRYSVNFRYIKSNTKKQMNNTKSRFTKKRKSFPRRLNRLFL